MLLQWNAIYPLVSKYHATYFLCEKSKAFKIFTKFNDFINDLHCLACFS